MDDQGQPLFPQFERMAESINSLVLDLGADNWASSRGFKVEEGLKNDFLPRALENVDLLKESGYVESFDWESYYSSLAKLANAVTTGEPVQVNFSSEFATQRNAIEYAKWKLRLSPYALFPDLDSDFKNNFPGTWQLGNEIYSIVNEYGVADRDSCNKTIIEVLEYLHLPYPLFKVRHILAKILGGFPYISKLLLDFLILESATQGFCGRSRTLTKFLGLLFELGVLKYFAHGFPKGFDHLTKALS
jgi:hypothetical protein